MTTTQQTAEELAIVIDEAYCGGYKIDVAALIRQALLAAGQHAQQGWRAITQAQKDGSWWLLKGGSTDEEDSYGAVSAADRNRPVIAKWDGEYWVYAYWDSNWRSTYNNPTHFMPLDSIATTTATDYIETRLAQIVSGDYRACGLSPEQIAADILLHMRVVGRAKEVLSDPNATLPCEAIEAEIGGGE